MKEDPVIIVDYGLSNILSVVNALTYLGYNCEVTNSPEKITGSKTLILPGVGSFKKAMNSIKELSIDEALSEAANQGAKILGICLGMQLLGSMSTEDGHTKGLNLINNKVDIFSSAEVGNQKIPHVGFDKVKKNADSLLFMELPTESDFYFLHSYRMLATEENGISAVCKYGIEFLAAFEKENIYGTQFHPEKSQTNGLKLLQNFLKI